jgi:opacity protein-like surface antigen
MQALSRFEPRRGRTVLVALLGLIAAAAVAIASHADAAPTQPASCAGFRVLHNDRIGPASFPAGTYTVNLDDSGLGCKSSAELFARFLEDYDGVLPTPWKVVAEGSGKASFQRGNQGGFSVELTKKGGEGGTNPDLGKLCPGTFTVNSTTIVGSLRFTKGAFLVYLPAGSGITCNRASVLFTKFLGAGGPLPRPWRLINQTATFYKPENPTRSAFRIEPLNGSGRR